MMIIAMIILYCIFQVQYAITDVVVMVREVADHQVILDHNCRNGEIGDTGRISGDHQNLL